MATRDAFGDVTFTIDHRGVVLRRVLENSGLPATIALPARLFQGVAARAIEDENANVTVTLDFSMPIPCSACRCWSPTISMTSQPTGAPGPTPTSCPCC